MKLRRRAETTCSRCGAANWTAGKVEVCAGCGKARSVSNWSYTLAGRERSTGTKVRARAEQIAAKAKTAFDEEGPRALRLPKTIPTLAAFSKTFLEHVEADQTREPKTKAGYVNGVRLLKDTALWPMHLNRIGTAESDAVAFPHSGSNANQGLSTLSVILSYAVTLDILHVRPKINKREENERIQILHPWMESAMLASAGPMIADAIRLIRNTGLRPQEAAALRREHIDFDAGLIRVVRGKTLRAQRSVSMSQQAREVLTRRLASGGEWVFPSGKCAVVSKRNEARLLLENGRSVLGVSRELHLGQATVRAFRDGKPLPGEGAQGSSHVTPGAISRAWRLLLREVNRNRAKAKLELIPADTVLYACRHTFATMFLVHGGDVGTLMHLMGHSDIKTTMRYVHLVDAMRAAEVMDEFNSQRRGLRLVKEA